ncbi:MAG TPA: molybdate ABC transporter substrate-binding protein [Candidatus Dormibacteraeota bacterium]
MAKALVSLLALLALAGCGNPGCASVPPQLAISGCGTAPKYVPPITVFAASSLQPAFDQIGKDAVAMLIAQPTFNYAGTQTLASALMQGAPGDVFASADTAHMTTLQNAGLISGQPRIFAHNKLEIAVAKGNPKGIHSLADLARPGVVLVLADPSVPAGKYAQQALAKAGVTVHPASLEQQVSGVLTKVALGEADAGIVYVSDVVTSGKVDGIVIPDAQNVIADYPIAVVKSTQSQIGATAFVDLVLSARGQAILKASGFEGV